jgi:hypothetical protein
LVLNGGEGNNFPRKSLSIIDLEETDNVYSSAKLVLGYLDEKLFSNDTLKSKLNGTYGLYSSNAFL